MHKGSAIWTIGHSTRSEEVFFGMLKQHDIQLLVDVRAFPGSRRHPQFNKENLRLAAEAKGIAYRHMPGLGGRRKPNPRSTNLVWRHPAFRAYADYMETEEFLHEIEVLEALAGESRTAYMCSEAPWWKCHRALISDFLKSRGWKVWHIMEKGKISEHPFTGPARTVKGHLHYGSGQQGLQTDDSNTL